VLPRPSVKINNTYGLEKAAQNEKLKSWREKKRKKIRITSGIIVVNKFSAVVLMVTTASIKSYTNKAI
jgi:hypothetical protein